MNEVIVQLWALPGMIWGSRADGFSVHLNEEDRKEFIDKRQGVVLGFNKTSQPQGESFKISVGNGFIGSSVALIIE